MWHAYRIKNAIQTPGILFTLHRNVNRQKRFIKKHIRPQLNEALKNNDGSLDGDDIKKITNYYGLAVPAILGESLCVLRGQKMSTQERWALTCQGAMTGLGDDFFDKQDTADSIIKLLVEKPEEIKGNNSAERLFLHFYRKSLQYAHNPTKTIQCLLKVFKAQVESRKQGTAGLLSKNEIQIITIEKGATSVLFYRTVLLNLLEDAEETALYEMGGLMQLGNDIFDVYKDCLKKIDTPVSTTKNVHAVRELFQSQMEKGFQLFYKTLYKRENINTFLRLIYMSLCSRCLVCLDQLEKKEKETNHVFSPHLYNRTDLVCDMQLTANKWKTIRAFLKNKI